MARYMEVSAEVPVLPLPTRGTEATKVFRWRPGLEDLTGAARRCRLELPLPRPFLILLSGSKPVLFVPTDFPELWLDSSWIAPRLLYTGS